MKYFIAVVPPIELASQIASIQAKWGQNALPPHITVKAPNSLPESEWWLPHVEALCQRSHPVDITLDGIGQFSSNTLYWNVISPGLIALHHALLELINPPLAERGLYFEGPAYTPHLTLLHYDQNQSINMLNAARQQATAFWSQPTKFTANQVRVFKSIGLNKHYEVYKNLSLTTNSPSAPPTFS